MHPARAGGKTNWMVQGPLLLLTCMRVYPHVQTPHMVYITYEKVIYNMKRWLNFPKRRMSFFQAGPNLACRPYSLADPTLACCSWQSGPWSDTSAKPFWGAPHSLPVCSLKLSRSPRPSTLLRLLWLSSFWGQGYQLQIALKGRIAIKLSPKPDIAACTKGPWVYFYLPYNHTPQDVMLFKDADEE